MAMRLGSLTIDCIDYVTGIGNVIQAPGHSVLRANTFSMAAVGQQATENGHFNWEF